MLLQVVTSRRTDGARTASYLWGRPANATATKALQSSEQSLHTASSGSQLQKERALTRQRKRLRSLIKKKAMFRRIS